jgi:hypothetical protein
MRVGIKHSSTRSGLFIFGFSLGYTSEKEAFWEIIDGQNEAIPTTQDSTTPRAA